MKCVFAAALLILVGSGLSSSAALFAYEPFDYTVGADITGAQLNGGTGFSTIWGVNSTGTTIAGNTPGDTIVSGSLSYVDMLGNSLLTSGNSAYMNGQTGTATPFRTLSTTRGAAGTTTWLSFVGVRLGPTTNNAGTPNNPYPRAANLSTYNGNSERAAFGSGSGVTNDAWAILPVGNAANRVATTTPMSDLSLVVVRIDHIGDTTVNDNAYLFLNPTLGVAPDILLADASSVGGFDFTINRIRPFAGNTDAANGRPWAEMAIDEIRLGETFDDVTPFTPVPEPSTWIIITGGLASLVLLRRRRA